MFSKIWSLFSLLALSLLVNSCGDLLGKKVIKKELDSSQFSVTCELDVDKFFDILHEDIKPQILCLRDNLHLFIRVVKSGKQGYLSRIQLEEYLRRYRPDVKPEVIRALKSVFDIGHLLTGEDPEYISKNTVDKVVNFALVFNREAALNFGPVFENETPVTYSLHQIAKDRIRGASIEIANELRNVYNPDRGGEIHRLKILELLENFTTEASRPSIEKIKKLLFAKKVLLGGDEDVITHLELESLFYNLSQLLTIGLDAVRFKHLVLSQESMMLLFKKDVEDFEELVTRQVLGNRDDQTLFTIAQATEAVKLFVDKEKFDIDQYKTVITEAKKIIMQGNAIEVKGRDLKQLFSHSKKVLGTGTFFHQVYRYFKKQIDVPGPVNIDFTDYRHTYPYNQKELDTFERILKKYRFMKGSVQQRENDENSWFANPTSYYTREYRRNPNSMVEIMMLEYGIQLVFSVYGSTSPNSDAVGGYSINKDQMRALVLKFENELIDLDLIRPQTAVSNADNISLLGTLFQFQSDKNAVMDVNEATEFGVSLFSALNVSEDIYSHMKANCRLDEFKRIDPQCFRQQFWKSLCSSYKDNKGRTYSYKQYYPLMFSYLNAPENCEDFVNSQENALFLDKAISAARSCNFYTDGPREEIPYEKGDFMTIMLALLHAETTILRWDLNGNNLMDPEEVEKAYDIYSPALDGFLEGKSPMIKKFKKQIFQYMIKYERVPDEKDFGSIWKFVKFLLSFNKQSPAYRKTIVSLLGVIGDQNKKLQTGPQFDCNLLRNPKSIPREPKPNVPVPTSFGVSNEDLKLALEPTETYLNTFADRYLDVLREELFEFSDEMSAGTVSSVKKVRQKNLRSIFTAISRDKVQMASIRAVVPDGSDLHKIAFVVATILSE